VNGQDVNDGVLEWILYLSTCGIVFYLGSFVLFLHSKIRHVAGFGEILTKANAHDGIGVSSVPSHLSVQVAGGVHLFPKLPSSPLYHNSPLSLLSRLRCPGSLAQKVLDHCLILSLCL